MTRPGCRWAWGLPPARCWWAASAATIGYYTVIGKAVNPACAAVRTAEEPGQIRLCAETFSRVSGLVAATALPPLIVKGPSGPVAVYAMSAGATSR